MQNKHTSGAGLVYIVCLMFSKIGAIWFPQYSVQLKQTLDVVKEAAIGYGFIMAGDGGGKAIPPSETKTSTDIPKTLGLLIIVGFILFSVLNP